MKIKIIIACGAICLWIARIYVRRRKWRAHYSGCCSTEFHAVSQVFRSLVRSKMEQGGAFAVYYKGQLVVDLWGGYADYGALRYRQQDSISMAYSATKAVTAVCIALLAERGSIDYTAPVSQYWPEFAQNDKGAVSINTLLCHRAGLIAIRDKHKLSLTRDDVTELSRLLAKQTPFWVPGTGQGYHALTYGLYVDQIVRRVDPKHRSLAQFFHDEIASVFDIDFYIGQPKDQHYRACREARASFGLSFLLFTVIPATVSFLASVIYSLYKYRTLYLLSYVGNPTDWKPRKLNDPVYRELNCGSSHGFGTARGLAKLMGILANGGAMDGHTLLSADSITKLNTQLSSEFDRLALRSITFGPGTMLRTVSSSCGRQRQIFGHIGIGGQMAFCDPETGLGWAYLTNYCNLLHGYIVDPRYAALERAMFDCVEQLRKHT